MKNALLDQQAPEVSDELLLAVLVCIGASGDGWLSHRENLLSNPSQIEREYHDMCTLLQKVRTLTNRKKKKKEGRKSLLLFRNLGEALALVK
jgi:hypothetical protein